MKSSHLDEFAATRYEEKKDGTQIVSVAGEVNLSSAPRLAELIQKARRQAGGDPPRVVVDLGGVEFMDTAGLEILMEGWNASRQPDERMCLVALDLAGRGQEVALVVSVSLSSPGGGELPVARSEMLGHLLLEHLFQDGLHAPAHSGLYIQRDVMLELVVLLGSSVSLLA